jgi:hypothetical protein
MAGGPRSGCAFVGGQPAIPSTSTRAIAPRQGGSPSSKCRVRGSRPLDPARSGYARSTGWQAAPSLAESDMHTYASEMLRFFSWTSSQSGDGGSNTVELWVVLPAIIQSIFWITVGVVTVLTFLHAKRTVLQPMRTEVYKLQIEVMSKVIKLFVGRNKVDLMNHFAFDHTVRAATELLFDDYARIRFEMTVDKEKVAYRKDLCPELRIALEAFQLDSGRFALPSYQEDAGSTSTKRLTWSEYKYHVLPISAGHTAAVREIKELLSDPLLPSECAVLLEKFLKTVDVNLERLQDVLVETVPRMTELYPDRESIARASIDWIHNEWNTRTVDVESIASEIIEFARNYFASDELAVSRRRR